MTTDFKKIIGYIVLLLAILLLFGKGGIVTPILGLGVNVSIFHITIEAVILFIAAYYLIRR